MDTIKIASLKAISIRESRKIDEKWIQEYIANDPSVLGLGDLILKDKERIQPNAGRLDLLLQDQDTSRRYEVEIQLGKTDESHIIRTIEYWDIERKRYPQYDHCAVIVAEDITARFLNVIQLFNGHIPLIAIQMKLYQVDEMYAIVFSKVLNEVRLGLEDDDEDATPTDRNYWEIKASKESVEVVDTLLEIIKEIDSTFSLKYNKHYIGLAKNGTAFNFAIMNAKRSFIRLEIKLEKSDEIDELIEKNEIDVLEYNLRSTRYKLRLSKGDLKNKKEVIKELLRRSYEYFI